MLACAAAFCARADEIEVIDARLAASEEGLLLSADFAFEFNPRLSEAVTNGVPLYFVVEFELTRPRWYWFDENAVSGRTQLRLSYHALSRQYRLWTGTLHQPFGTLTEALRVLGRVRSWAVLEHDQVAADVNYRELRLDSPWKRFIFLPPRPMTAPAAEAQPGAPK